MKGYLSPSQREYVLFHLSHHLTMTPEIRGNFGFIKNLSEASGYTGSILFLSSEVSLDLNNILYVDNLPILFPLSDRRDFYFFDHSDNLIFPHDILKSAFYLLSGYQEYINTDSKDNLNRFSFIDSVQYKLNIVNKPVVNYYFAHIAEAIKLYCSKKKLSFSIRRLFGNFGFLLTHDIDSVDLYTLNHVVYKIKEILGLKKSRLARHINLKLVIIGFLKYFHIFRKDNPHWNFTFMRKLERDNHFKSVFFFLDKGVLHNDAYYSFFENRLTKLFDYLQKEQCEIGLHGTVESITNRKKMRSSLDKLKEASNAPILGTRQHRLLWKHPETAIIQNEIGVKYDSTLGFAAHEGFRNSYCSPFKLYDFKNDCIINIWEFPLQVMDVTLFAYQNYSTEEALKRSIDIIHEIKKFGGVFTLLWHNSFFDEHTYPGVTNFYSKLLERIAESGAENVLGCELYKRMESY